MKKNYRKLSLTALILLCFTSLISASTYYVATSGNDSNPGTQTSPFLTPNKAVSIVQPGDTVYLRGGTYMLTAGVKVKAAQNARADARIYFWGYPGERVIIDGSQIVATTEAQFKMARCIYHNHEANYWHYKNLELCNAKDNGMKMEGSHNIIENCKFYGNNDTGLQIGMYKDFSIEETKSLPAGEPQFNPGFQFCSYNQMINCDAYNNYDYVASNGSSDDGGDADGFAAKLFPGPGNEFHGCRAWNNSDDNWDLYMVYHPVVIENCWSWNAGYDKNGVARQNGNGFKLGGGGTSGGIGFDQSVGAHVVMNCISFDNLHKGFDQNNAYEGMYIFNNLAWNNEYNYRFPTVIPYGTMHMRNNIGFKPRTLNHEFLSADKPGAKVPDTDFNSWTKLDGCDPYKDGNKVGGVAKKVKDYTSQFKSLSAVLAKADRQADGSLPDNDFGKLIDGSVFIDAGQIIENYNATSELPVGEVPVGYVAITNINIPYTGVSADMGAYEVGDATEGTLKLTTGNASQYVYTGSPITPIVYKWGGAATDARVENLPAGMIFTKDNTLKSITLSGNPTEAKTYTVTATGGKAEVSLTGNITISAVAPATLVCTTGNATQTINIGSAIQTIQFVWGGGATGVDFINIPEGLTYNQSGNTLTISGIPTKDGSYTVTTTGGMAPLTLSGTITRIIPVKVLTGNWYSFPEEFAQRHADLQGDVVTLSGDSYTVWNPAFVESASPAMPFGHAGALVLGRSKGYILFTLPSLVEFKMNMYTTGGRTVDIYYGKPGTDESTWTKYSTGSFAKGSFSSWDVMSKAGIADTKEPIAVKIINNTSGGEIRIYDLYIKVYDVTVNTGLTAPVAEKVSYSIYQTETGLVVSGEMASLKVFNLSGQLLTQSIMSQYVDIARLSKGVYLLQIVDKAGRKEVKKFVK